MELLHPWGVLVWAGSSLTWGQLLFWVSVTVWHEWGAPHLSGYISQMLISTGVCHVALPEAWHPCQPRHPCHIVDGLRMLTMFREVINQNVAQKASCVHMHWLLSFKKTSILFWLSNWLRKLSSAPCFGFIRLMIHFFVNLNIYVSWHT